jgi:hypothetical protein|uniref:Uncharacterized protein n=1 Tax=candidate division WOR-3 bacterium TaxID=2052148 RepID=A0A7V3VU33_UNCW3
MIDTIGTWIAALLTLAIYSFLYKDNPFYKVAENIFVGVSAGYWTVVLWYDFAWPNLFEPLFTKGQWYNIFPIFIGLLMFAPLIPKISWMIRIPLTFTMGIAMAVSITQIVQGDIFPQLQATFLPLKGIPIFNTFSNLLIIFGVICTLAYFYFSKEHKGVLGIGAKIGIWFMMVSFGASFGYTIMARVSLFIGRVYFLLHNWLGVI